jgi:hypothetical protein
MDECCPKASDFKSQLHNRANIPSEPNKFKSSRHVIWLPDSKAQHESGRKARLIQGRFYNSFGQAVGTTLLFLLSRIFRGMFIS